MKRKKKIIVWTLVVLLVGGLGLVGVGEWVIQRRSANRKRDGIAASIAGNHELAAELLGRFLQRNPHDVEALTYYVKSRELAELPNGQHLGMTMAALKQLIGDAPDRLDDRKHLLELYARFERRPEALDAANAILTNHDHPEWAKDLRTLEIKTEVLRKLQKDREALATAEVWSKLAPLDIKAHMARMELHARLHHPQQAMIDDAEALRKAHPNDPRFELLEGYAYGVGTEVPDAYEQAVQWTNTAASHPQLSEDVAHLIIIQYDALGMPEKSMEMLQILCKRGAGPDVQHDLAKRLWERGQWEPAAAALADVNPQDPSSDATLVALKAITLANLGKSSESNAARKALAARKQAAASAWVLLLRRIVDAAQLDDRQVASACRSAMMIDSRNPYLAYYLGDSEARLGELDEAVEAWRVSEANDGTWSLPAERLVEALLQGNHPEQAQWIARDAMRRSHTTGAAIALARAYSSGNAANAEEIAQLGKLVDEILHVLPDEERTVLIRVDWLARQGKKDEATTVARAELQHTPPPSEHFFLALADKSRQFGLGLEQQCYASSQKAHGVTADLAYCEAVDRYLAGQKEQGNKIFEQAASASGKSDDLAWKRARAQYLDITADPSAKSAWIALAEANPKDVSIQHGLINARSLRGDWDAMQPAIDRLKDLTGPRAIEWRLAESRLMVESPRNEDDYDKGALLLNQVIQDDSNETQAHVLLARALVHMKRVDGAIEQFTIASKQDPSSVPIALQLAALLQSRGDFDRVQQELDRITPSIHTPTERQEAAALLADQGNSDRALELLEHPTTRPGEDSLNKPDLLLAELYRRRRNFAKADEVVRTLMQHPDLPTIRFAASLYAAEGRPADAQAALAHLDDLKLASGIKELALGSFYGETGDLAKAIEHYQQATLQSPANPVAWRILATTQMDLGKGDEAMATVENGLHAIPNDPALTAINANAKLLREAASMPNQRSVALYVMNDPTHSEAGIELLQTLADAHDSNDIERFASRLQQLTERRPDFLPAQVELVECLASMGRIEDALVAAKHAETNFPSSPEPARVAVQVCAAAQRWEEMKEAAEVWRKRAIEDPMPADAALAHALVRLRFPEDALSVLKPYLEVASANPDRYSEVIATQAAALVHSGAVDAAANLLWPLTSRSYHWRVQWMQTALDIPEGAKALEWLKRISAAITADQMGERIALAETYDLLGSRLNEPEVTQTSTEMFSGLMADPHVTPLAMLAAAGQAERHSDLTTAESLYRRALSVDPNLWIAHNNLAMILLRRQEDPKQAAEHIAAAVRLQPHQATLRDTFAQVQAGSGNAKAAADAERLALQLDPDDPRWRVRLAKYLFDSGDVTGAQEVVHSIETRRLDMDRLSPIQRAEVARELEAVRKRATGTKTL